MANPSPPLSDPVSVLYSQKAKINAAKTLKDYAVDVAERLSDDDVRIIDGLSQEQQLTIQKLLDLHISRLCSPQSPRFCHVSAASTSPIATSEAAIETLQATAELSHDAVIGVKKDLDEFKSTVTRSYVDMKQSWAENKTGVESHFGASEATPPTTPSTGADARDSKPLLTEPQPDPYSTIPPYSVANTRVEAAKIATFVELWDRDESYSGELYDLLGDKVRMMLGLCYRLGFHASQFHAAFSFILTGRAHIYYTHNVHPKDTFAMAYKKVKDHFDTDVNRRFYFTEWTTITFESYRKRYRADHDGAVDLWEVLESLLDDLQLCQRALGPDFAADIQLREAVLRACSGAPAFDNACFKALSNPRQPSEEFFSTLRSNLQVYLNRRPSRPQPAHRMSGFDVW